MKTDELRELEVWIGEHIFGGKITRTPHLATDVYMQTESDRRLMMSPYPVPRYTEDKAAAMEVLEKCVETVTSERLGLDGVVVFSPHEQVMPEWTVRTRDESRGAVIVEGKTLPLAICLFAKKLYEDKT